MKPTSEAFDGAELKMVGSAVFGRYPKISVENTYNMIISDDWLADYAGYDVAIAMISLNGFGRGIYHSTKQNLLYVAFFNSIYTINPNLNVNLIGLIDTFYGDVFFAEDIQGDIAICDKTDIWIYNKNLAPPFRKATKDGILPLDFIPGYIAYHDGRFLTVDLRSSTWNISDPLATPPNTQFPNSGNFQGTFQTKPDIPVAVLPFPGLGSTVFVMGSIVTELWTDVGGQFFPYQRQSGVNIDYGCLNPDTIATLETMACWLGGNDRSGPVILVSRGGPPEPISTDGINFKLASLTAPQDSHGFMFKEDGHIFYQVTFPTDNYSLTYDFTTQKFFTLTDENLDYHIAKRVAFFNNTYYFVSLNDTNLYQMSTNDTTYAGMQIPRIRLANTLRAPDTSPFILNNITFPMEQGIDSPVVTNSVQSVHVTNGGTGYTTAQVKFEGGNGDGAMATAIISSGVITGINVTYGGTNYTYAPIVSIIGDGQGAEAFSVINQIMPHVDLSISYDGGYTFSSPVTMLMNPLGKRRNRVVYYNLGWSNEFTMQFQFHSFGRMVVGNGTMSAYE